MTRDALLLSPLCAPSSVDHTKRACYRSTFRKSSGWNDFINFSYVSHGKVYISTNFNTHISININFVDSNSNDKRFVESRQ